MFRYLIIFIIFFNILQINSSNFEINSFENYYYDEGFGVWVYGIAKIENNSGEENPLVIETINNKKNIFVPVIIMPYDKSRHETHLLLPIECFFRYLPIFCCFKKIKGPGWLIFLQDGNLKNTFIKLDDSFANLNVWYRDMLEQL